LLHNGVIGYGYAQNCVVTLFGKIELANYPVVDSSAQTDQGSLSSIRLGDPAQNGKIGPLHDEQKGKEIFSRKIKIKTQKG
jgi:hypothetical protein